MGSLILHFLLDQNKIAVTSIEIIATATVLKDIDIKSKGIPFGGLLTQWYLVAICKAVKQKNDLFHLLNIFFLNGIFLQKGDAL